MHILGRPSLGFLTNRGLPYQALQAIRDELGTSAKDYAVGFRVLLPRRADSMNSSACVVAEAEVRSFWEPRPAALTPRTAASAATNGHNRPFFRVRLAAKFRAKHLVSRPSMKALATPAKRPLFCKVIKVCLHLTLDQCDCFISTCLQWCSHSSRFGGPSEVTWDLAFTVASCTSNCLRVAAT